MTTQGLYAIYREAYAGTERVFARRHLGQALFLARGGTGLPAVERTIAELGVHDATNGTPMRTREQFASILEHGTPMLRRLAQRDSGGEAAGDPSRPRAA
jgi:hypothetical protein